MTETMDRGIVRAPVLDCAAMPSNTTTSGHPARNPLKGQRPTTRPAVLARSATPCNTVRAISR